MELLSSLQFRIFLLLCLLPYSLGKPPKNLSRMRNKGSFAGSNINIGSLQNSGQTITLYKESEEIVDPSNSSNLELLTKRDRDDLEYIIDGELSEEIEEETKVLEELEEITTTEKGRESEENERNTEILEILPSTITLPAPLAPEVLLSTKISDTEIMKDLLSYGYDWRVRPPGQNTSIIGGGAVIVWVNMLIRSISRIDNVNMEYSVQLTFRESWVDKRLAYGEKMDGDNVPDFIILAAGQQIWMPDSFFQNEKQAHRHMIDKPNVLIRVHKDGLILYSVRISLVLSCPMHLQYYPMDIQKCLIDLASYAYTTNDIEYEWKINDPVQLKDGLSSSLPSFHLKNVTTTYCTSKTNTGTYSCLRTVLELERQFSYYLLQLYIPSTMLVIVSWVSFWLDRSAVPARVTLGVTTLLTMTTQSSGINSKLPPVAYIKAIDIWIGACMTFIFGALLEFAFVTYLGSRLESKKKSRAAKKSHPPLIPQSNDVWIPKSLADLQHTEITMNMHTPMNRKEPRRTQSYVGRVWSNSLKDTDTPKRADLISRVMFPLMFIGFNILYWTHFGQYQNSSS